MNEARLKEVLDVCSSILKDVINIGTQIEPKSNHFNLYLDAMKKKLHTVKGFLNICHLNEVAIQIGRIESKITTFRNDGTTLADIYLCHNTLHAIEKSLETYKLSLKQDLDAHSSQEDPKIEQSFEAIICMNEPPQHLKSFLKERNISYVKKTTVGEIYAMEHHKLENKFFLFSPEVKGIPATYSVNILSRFLKNSFYAIIFDNELDIEKHIPIMPFANFSCFSSEAKNFKDYMNDFVTSKFKRHLYLNEPQNI